jgi:hypothetical protein
MILSIVKHRRRMHAYCTRTHMEHPEGGKVGAVPDIEKHGGFIFQDNIEVSLTVHRPLRISSHQHHHTFARGAGTHHLATFSFFFGSISSIPPENMGYCSSMQRRIPRSTEDFTLLCVLT